MLVMKSVLTSKTYCWRNLDPNHDDTEILEQVAISYNLKRQTSKIVIQILMAFK